MKSFKWPWLVLALALGGCMGIAYAQVALQPILLSDVKENGTAVGYFHKQPQPYYWNFVRGADVSGRNLILGANSAPFNADLGTTLAPSGVTLGTLNQAQPTCNSSERGTMWTKTWGPDAGANDLTFQCCYRGDGGVYLWKAGYCQ